MAEPEFLLVDGQAVVDWHGDRPETVLMSTDAVEAWIEERNRLVRRVSAMEMLLTIIRLGRRPNRADWEAAELQPIAPQTRVDILARKPRS